tara:strand:+ start:75 stop:608 length:534 start_codon:yes stop_codon:yes gene_type:complete
MLRKRKALTKNECEDIINIFETTSTPGMGEDEKREDEERGYTAVGGDLQRRKYVKLRNALSDSLREYKMKNHFLSTIDNWYPCPRFNIQKYLPGNYYKPEHCEHGVYEESARRIVAWMFYLNDIRNKGGTHWPQQNFTSKPRAGDLYIWPAGWTHTHYGIPTPNEIKYIITGWCVQV